MAAVVVLDDLDGVPERTGDDGVAVVLDGQVAEFEDADVEFVGPEGGVGVDTAEEVGLFLNGSEGGTGGTHFIGTQDEGGEDGIGDPAGSHVGGAVAAQADGDGLAEEAARGDARHTAVLPYQVPQAALYIYRKVGKVLFVLVVDEGFEDATGRTFGDLIVEGVEGVAEGADLGAVELGVVDVAGETVVLPDDDAALGAAVPEGFHHGMEIVAAYVGGAAAGFVLVDVGEDETVGLRPDPDLVLLLGNGEFLVFVTAVTQVGEDVGAGREGVSGQCSVISEQ